MIANKRKRHDASGVLNNNKQTVEQPISANDSSASGLIKILDFIFLLLQEDKNYVCRFRLGWGDDKATLRKVGGRQELIRLACFGVGRISVRIEQATI